MNIRENLIIDIETDVSDSESDSKTLIFLVDEDLKDLGYNVHSLQVQPAKRHPDSNGVLPLTDEELAEFSCLFYECRSIDIIKVVPRTNSIKIYFVRPNLTFELDAIFTENYKAILYLDKLFELGGK